MQTFLRLTAENSRTHPSHSGQFCPGRCLIFSSKCSIKMNLNSGVFMYKISGCLGFLFLNCTPSSKIIGR